MVQVIRMWDRQSTRHNWQLYVEDTNPDRISALIDLHLGRLIDNPKYHDAQIATDTHTYVNGHRIRQDSTRPRNAKMDMIISVKEHIGG